MASGNRGHFFSLEIRLIQKKPDPGSYSHKNQHLASNIPRDNLLENPAYPELAGNADVAAIPHFHSNFPGGKDFVRRLSAFQLPVGLNHSWTGAHINYRYWLPGDVE
jgi:hypothetical protein